MSLIVVCGCTHTQAVNRDNGADKVKIYRKAEPPENCIEIRAFTAESGKGCGAFGSRGTYEAAYNTFRNMVADMGGNVGLIQSEEPPHQAYGCFVNTYTMNGVAYTCPDNTIKNK